MWKVEFESHQVQAEIEDLIENGELTIEDQAVIHSWIRQLKFHGPDSIRGEYKWADHPLKGEWKGFRASAYSSSGRIIYRINEGQLKILIARITDKHDYKRR